jgi:hypothetical protein
MVRNRITAVQNPPGSIRSRTDSHKLSVLFVFPDSLVALGTIVFKLGFAEEDPVGSLKVFS